MLRQRSRRQTTVELAKRLGSFSPPVRQRQPMDMLERVYAAASTTGLTTLLQEDGRADNEPCPCGSGKGYKKCCLSKDEKARHETAEKSAKKAVGPQSGKFKSASAILAESASTQSAARTPYDLLAMIVTPVPALQKIRPWAHRPDATAVATSAVAST